MRWAVALSVALILTGASILAYALQLPAYSEANAPDRLTQELDSKPEQVRVDEWMSRIRAYETPEKRLSDLGRGLCAAGLGLLLACRICSLYHKHAWMRSPAFILVLWLTLWAVRIPLSFWYYGLRQYRFDYPIWADAIAIPIFQETALWIAGALATSVVLLSLLRKHPLPTQIRWVKPTTARSWIRTLFLGAWLVAMGTCIAAGIPDGDEGGVFACMVATVVILALASTREAANP